MNRVSFATVLLLLFVGAATWCETMQLVWRYPTGGRIRSLPVVGPGGWIYALSDDGFLYSFTPGGKTRWATNLGGLVVDSLSVGRDGTVYAGLRNNRIVAVNPQGGAIWSFDAGSAILGNPATADDGTVFVGTSRGTLYSVSVNGSLEWKITLPARMTSAPVLDAQETVYLGGSDGRLYALNRWGRFKWSLPLGGHPLSVAVGGRGALYVRVSDDVILKVSPGGKVMWQKRIPAESFGPLIADERVFIASRKGEVAAYDAAGNQLWSKKLGDRLTGSWLLGRRSVYLMTKGSNVVTLGRQDGSSEGRTKVGSVGGMAVADNGTLLIGGDDWLLYAYSGVPPDPQAAWAAPSSDERNSGHGAGRFDESSLNRQLGLVPDYLALRAQEDPTSRYALSSLLAEIQSRMVSGGLGKSTWYVRRLLERIVGVGVLDPVIEGNSVVNDFPDVRAEAAGLLGRVGSLSARNALIRVLNEESDPVAASQEILALGRIGSDGDGRATRGIAFALTRLEAGSGRGEARMAMAAIHAVAAISHYEGEVPDSAGRVMLLSIYRGDYPSQVRDEALTLLRNHRP